MKIMDSTAFAQQPCPREGSGVELLRVCVSALSDAISVMHASTEFHFLSESFSRTRIIVPTYTAVREHSTGGRSPPLPVITIVKWTIASVMTHAVPLEHRDVQFK